MIADRDIKSYYMNPNGDSIDEHLLANFDQEKAEVNGFRYKLIIATDPFAMRGFDYRGKDIGITLLLAKSFAFEREAIQGLNRVGRFGDQCKRIMLASVPLIDETQARVYSSFLTSFMIARHALDIDLEKKRE
jgi:hypothetical protein